MGAKTSFRVCISCGPTGLDLESVHVTARRFKLNVAALVLARIVLIGSGMVTTVVVSRYLGPGRYGRLALAVAIVGIISICGDAGISTVATREMARAGREQSRHRIATTALELTSGLTLMFSLTTAGVAFVAFSGVANQKLRDAIIALLIVGLATPAAQILAAANVSAGGAYRAALAQSAAGLATVAAVLVVAGMHLGIGWVAAAFGSLPLFTALVFILAASRRQTRSGLPPDQWLGFVREALPVGLVNLVNVLYVRADVVLVAILGTATDVGLYGLAYNLVNALIAIPGMVASALQPVLVRSVDDERSFSTVVAYMALVMQVAALGTAGLLVWFGPEIAIVMGGRAYAAAGTSISFLVLGVAVSFPNGVFGASLIALGRQRQIVLPLVVAFIANVILNLILIPAAGVNGAAASFLISETMALGVVILLYRRVVPAVPQRLGVTLLAAACESLPCAIGPQLVSLPAFLTIALWGSIGTIFYVLVLWRAGLLQLLLNPSWDQEVTGSATG